MCPPAPSIDASPARADVALFTRLLGDTARNGDRLPGVVLEAGGGASSAWWAHVQQTLAAHSLVLAYDRAGLGRSESTVVDAGAQRSSERLHVVLKRLADQGLSPPYLLIGHSLGGLYAQAFASAHPELVCGLVLVDHTVAPAGNRLGLRMLCALLRGGASLVSAWASCWPAQRWRFMRRIGLRLAGELPVPAVVEVVDLLSRPRHLAAALREIGGLPALLSWLEVHPLRPELPVLCIGAGSVRSSQGLRPRSSHQRKRREDCARKLGPGARQVWIEAADHASLLTGRKEAAALAEAVLLFAAQIRASHAEKSLGAGA